MAEAGWVWYLMLELAALLTPRQGSAVLRVHWRLSGRGPRVWLSCGLAEAAGVWLVRGKRVIPFWKSASHESGHLIAENG